MGAECDDCGEHVSNSDLTTYQGLRICPACYTREQLGLVFDKSGVPISRNGRPLTKKDKKEFAYYFR